MNSQKIKTRLISIFGYKFVSCIQGVRFVYLLKSRRILEAETKLLDYFLKAGDIAVDVGANGADWTYQMHRRVGPEGKIYAFEADPYYAMATDIAIKMLRIPGVHLFPFGLSDKDEEVALRVFDSSSTRLTGRGFVDRSARKEDVGVSLISLRRLDSLAQMYPQILQTNLIKCDVEGFELFVFRGASEVLKVSRPFIALEIGNFEHHGYTSQDVYDFFSMREYVFFTMIGENQIAPVDFLLNHPGAISVNRILVPREKLESIDFLIST